MAHIAWGIIVACGKDEQLTAEADTAFLSLGSKPVLAYSLLAYENCADIDGVVVVVRKERMESLVGLANMFGLSKVKRVVAGALNRRSALQNGLKALDDDVTIVSVHEASRPCVTSTLISETVKSAKRYGSGVAGRRMQDPVRGVQKGQIVSDEPDSSKLWCVVKPQSYKREILEAALDAAAKKKVALDDESAALTLIKKPVHLVPSPVRNMRIRSGDDLRLATALADELPS